jgi:hypothetical protein
MDEHGWYYGEPLQRSRKRLPLLLVQLRQQNAFETANTLEKLRNASEMQQVCITTAKVTLRHR